MCVPTAEKLRIEIQLWPIYIADSLSLFLFEVSGTSSKYYLHISVVGTERNGTTIVTR